MEGTPDTTPQFAAIDWGDQKHFWSLQADGSEKRERGDMPHTPEAIESWVVMLSSRFSGRPIAVALEQSRGALVFMLSKYEHPHLYPIHPRAAAQFRGALYPSGAKDDPVDADLLLDLVGHHRSHLPFESGQRTDSLGPPSGGSAPQAGERENAPNQPPHGTTESLFSADAGLV